MRLKRGTGAADGEAMLRIPLLRLLAVALMLCMLAVGAASAAASVPAATHAATVAGDDEDPGEDWGEEDPGDDWGDEDPDDDWGDDGACVATDDACFEDDEELCFADGDWEEWEDEEFASSAQDDEDADDDGAWDDEACDEDAEEATVAAPRLSALHATPARRGAVRVRFRLDRGGRVTLALQHLSGARASGCGRAARAARRCRTLRGSATVAGRKGVNATTLRRWQGRALKPGSYRLTATPAEAGSRGASTTFTLRVAARGH